MVLVSNFAQTVVANEVQALQPRGDVTEGGNVRVRSVPAICRRSPALGRSIQTEEEKRLLLELARTWRKAASASVAMVSGTQERPMPRLDEGKEFGTADRARRHADELAAQLGHNRSSHENRGRFVRVRDENGEEVYRAPLTNSS
jgi:hypothetical protein